MSRIEEKFSTIFSQGKKALIPFFTANYPSENSFREILLMADAAGMDFIEIGVPFSDPLADGKLIQHSSQWVLRNKFSFSKLLEDMARLKESLNSPLILMSYYNPLLQKGLLKIGKEIREAGFDGVIIPDLPFEESLPLKQTLSSQGIDLIYLVAPTTSHQRLRKICSSSRGFIYLVSLAGVTGMRDKLPENLTAYIDRVRQITSRPLCVGFGISRLDQAVKAVEKADGVILGSVLVNYLKGKENNKNAYKNLEKFLREFLI